MAEESDVTPEQKRLARHALGLPNDKMVSYANGLQIERNTAAHRNLVSLIDQSLALVDTIGRRYISFHLTRAGAELALKPGERLCEEDFPE